MGPLEVPSSLRSLRRGINQDKDVRIDISMFFASGDEDEMHHRGCSRFLA
jgi:hypothetical protein